MKKILPFEVIKQLIQKAGFGTYQLYEMPGNNKVAGSHLTAEADSSESANKMSAADLVIDLQSYIDQLGDGMYRIVLKKSNKSQESTAVNYFFQVREGQPEASGSPTLGNVYADRIDADKIETMVNSRVEKLLALKEAEWEAKREMEALRAEIEFLKKRKPSRKKQSDLAGLLNLALVGGSAFISEQWPNTRPMVEKALTALGQMDAGDDDEEDEEEETGFNRPS